MNNKIGMSRNLVLRVLCLKNSIPAQAPNGPKNPAKKSLDSGILQPPLLLFNLSTPKTTKETIFIVTITRKTCK